jgi:hypothetical protein
VTITGGTADSTYERNATEITTAIGKNWPAKNKIKQIKKTIVPTVM